MARKPITKIPDTILCLKAQRRKRLSFVPSGSYSLVSCGTNSLSTVSLRGSVASTAPRVNRERTGGNSLSSGMRTVHPVTSGSSLPEVITAAFKAESMSSKLSGVISM